MINSRLFYIFSFLILVAERFFQADCIFELHDYDVFNANVLDYKKSLSES